MCDSRPPCQHAVCGRSRLWGSLAFSFLGLFSGVSLKSISYEASRASPDIFVTFYRLDVTDHSMAQAVPSAGSRGVSVCADLSARILTESERDVGYVQDVA